MEEKYTQNELWKLYEKLPEEIKDVMFSAQTGDYIFNICQRNGIEDGESISFVAKSVGEVLLGILPPNKMAEVLAKNLNIPESRAKKITSEIEHFIFQPIKNHLENLYKSVLETKEIKKKEEAPPKRDIYREPIE